MSINTGFHTNIELPALKLGDEKVHYNPDPEEHKGIGVKLGKLKIIHVDRDELYDAYAVTTKGMSGFFERIYAWLSIHITLRDQDADFLKRWGVNDEEIRRITDILHPNIEETATKTGNAAQQVVGDGSPRESAIYDYDYDYDYGNDDDETWGWWGPNGELMLESDYNKAQSWPPFPEHPIQSPVDGQVESTDEQLDAATDQLTHRLIELLPEDEEELEAAQEHVKDSLAQRVMLDPRELESLLQQPADAQTQQSQQAFIDSMNQYGWELDLEAANKATQGRQDTFTQEEIEHANQALATFDHHNIPDLDQKAMLAGTLLERYIEPGEPSSFVVIAKELISQFEKVDEAIEALPGVLEETVDGLNRILIPEEIFSREGMEGVKAVLEDAKSFDEDTFKSWPVSQQLVYCERLKTALERLEKNGEVTRDDLRAPLESVLESIPPPGQEGVVDQFKRGLQKSVYIVGSLVTLSLASSWLNNRKEEEEAGAWLARYGAGGSKPQKPLAEAAISRGATVLGAGSPLWERNRFRVFDGVSQSPQLFTMVRQPEHEKLMEALTANAVFNVGGQPGLATDDQLVAQRMEAVDRLIKEGGWAPGKVFQLVIENTAATGASYEESIFALGNATQTLYRLGAPPDAMALQLMEHAAIYGSGNAQSCAARTLKSVAGYEGGLRTPTLMDFCPSAPLEGEEYNPFLGAICEMAKKVAIGRCGVGPHAAVPLAQHLSAAVKSGMLTKEQAEATMAQCKAISKGDPEIEAMLAAESERLKQSGYTHIGWGAGIMAAGLAFPPAAPFAAIYGGLTSAVGLFELQQSEQNL